MSTDHDIIHSQNYFSIIPAEVDDCESLDDGAKLLYDILDYQVTIPNILLQSPIPKTGIRLYALLTSLARMKGYCFATNSYLSKKIGIHPRKIQMRLEQIKKIGLIEVEVERIGIKTNRKIWMVNDPRKRQNSEEIKNIFKHAPKSHGGTPRADVHIKGKDYYLSKKSMKDARVHASPILPKEFGQVTPTGKSIFESKKESLTCKIEKKEKKADIVRTRPKPLQTPKPNPSLTCKKEKKEGKEFLNQEQLQLFEWLLTLKINTDEDTLAWWAKNYTRQRIQDVYDISVRKNKGNLGGYMMKLLKNGCPVENKNVIANHAYAEKFVSENRWTNVEINQKYMIVDPDLVRAEITFDMDPKIFPSYLQEKYECFG